MRARVGWISLAILILWCGLIFGTSSTVILSRSFFAWWNAHVFTDEASARRFLIFWGMSWFVIVKGWHAIEFAILFLMSRAAIDRVTNSRTWRNTTSAMAFTILFAMSDEYHQTFVPGRGGNWTDVGIDSLGAGLAALLTHRWRKPPLEHRS